LCANEILQKHEINLHSTTSIKPSAVLLKPHQAKHKNKTPF